MRQDHRDSRGVSSLPENERFAMLFEELFFCSPSLKNTLDPISECHGRLMRTQDGSWLMLDYDLGEPSQAS